MLAIEAREQRNALGGAVFMHSLLAAALLLSMNWSEKPQPVVQVELWSSPPPSLARPTEAAPAQDAAPPPQEKVDITTNKEPPRPKPKPEDLKREAERKAAEKAAAKKAAAEKAAAEKALQKKLAEEREAQRLEAVRAAELDRLLKSETKAKTMDRGRDIATKAGAAEGAEIGSKTGVDADYVSLIQARIRARINYADRASGNPEAIVTVEQLPSGEVVRVQLSRPSGVKAWDDSVQRAIWAASPLPKKKDGTVSRTLELRFRPREAP